MRRNKTNAIEAIEELLRKYRDGDVFPHNRSHCPLCIYNGVNGDHWNECPACPYNIPEVKALIPQKAIKFMACIGWIEIGESLKFGTPGRIARIREILALCKKLPAYKFKAIKKLNNLKTESEEKSNE